jgi:hypothetical protein
MATSGGGHVTLTQRWLKRTGTGYISENYQRRLQRNGVTQAEFRDKSFNLASARGHDKTPEHGLADAARNPEKYSDYLEKRQPEGKNFGGDLNRKTLERLFISNFDRLFGEQYNYSEAKVRINAERATMNQLKMGAFGTAEELEALAHYQRPGMRAVGRFYRDGSKTRNPFWYHNSED